MVRHGHERVDGRQSSGCGVHFADFLCLPLIECQDNSRRTLALSIPNGFKFLASILGWCRRLVIENSRLAITKEKERGGEKFTT